MSANDLRRTFRCVYGTKVQLDIASRESIMDSSLGGPLSLLAQAQACAVDDFFFGADRTCISGLM
jgi:hypothetical protein